MYLVFDTETTGLPLLTTCRSAASGALDAYSTPTYAPLVGCSGLLGGPFKGSCPPAVDRNRL